MITDCWVYMCRPESFPLSVMLFASTTKWDSINGFDFGLTLIH